MCEVGVGWDQDACRRVESMSCFKYSWHDLKRTSHLNSNEDVCLSDAVEVADKP